MSEPVTNVEIEDVLSSIRRLVAEGDRLRPGPASQPPLTLAPEDAVPPRPVHSSAPEPVIQEKPAPEKFVLTPALRVAEPEPVAAPEAADQDPAAVPEPMPEAPRDVAADALDDSAETATTTLVWDEAEDEHLTPTAPPEEQAKVEAPEAAEPLDPAAPAYATAGRSRLESTIAELEAAITGQEDEFEPDGSEATPVMDWATDAVDATFLSSRVPTHAQPIEDAQEVSDDVAEAPADATGFSVSDTGPGDTDADDAEAADTDLTATTTDPDGAPLEGEVDEALTAYLEEEEILDEETLRTMVAEIIHQELQGALGERITRNVRKLVRREIHRVLSSQEFD